MKSSFLMYPNAHYETSFVDVTNEWKYARFYYWALLDEVLPALNEASEYADQCYTMKDGDCKECGSRLDDEECSPESETEEERERWLCEHLAAGNPK